MTSNSKTILYMYHFQIGTPGENKEQIWIDATIHAREWISSAVAMYFIERVRI